MKRKRIFMAKKTILSILFMILFTFNIFPSIAIKAEGSNVSVSYASQVQKVGWQSYVKDGQTSGTTGEALRLEGIKVVIEGDKDLGVKYSSKLENGDWQDYVTDGYLSGTEGQGKAIEAVKIALTGNDASKYSIYYRVYAQSYGWLGWAKDGDKAGTSFHSKRLEAIQIKVLPKSDTSITTSSDSYIMAVPDILYSCHVQKVGWQSYVKNGQMSGTTGKSLRLEGIKIKLANAEVNGGISYCTQIQSIGWQNFVDDNELSGTTGRALRLESIKIKLTGELSNYFDVYYRVHSQSYGWLGWAKNGAICGTVGLAKRLEGIQIVLVDKGSSPPGAVSGSYIYKGASNSIIRNDNTKIINNKVYVNGVSNSIALKYNTAYTYLDNLENEILVNINKYRSSKKLCTLNSNDNLKTIARYKATGMLEYNKPGNASTFLLDVAKDRDGTDGNLIYKMGVNFRQYKYNISNTSFVVSSTSIPTIMNNLRQNWMLDFRRMENVGIAVCEGRGKYYISVYYTGKLLR